MTRTDQPVEKSRHRKVDEESRHTEERISERIEVLTLVVPHVMTEILGQIKDIPQERNVTRTQERISQRIGAQTPHVMQEILEEIKGILWDRTSERTSEQQS